MRLLWLIPVRDYLLAERFASRELAVRRLSWPRWRRAVRPLGALTWWSAVLVNIFWGAPGVRWAREVAYGLMLVTVCCVAYGTLDAVAARRGWRSKLLPSRPVPAQTGPLPPAG